MADNKTRAGRELNRRVEVCAMFKVEKRVRVTEWTTAKMAKAGWRQPAFFRTCFLSCAMGVRYGDKMMTFNILQAR